MRHSLLSVLPQLVLSSVVAITGTGFVTAVAMAAEPAAGNVARGAISWSQNCSRCHEMRGPAEFRDDQWRPIVTHMRIRAGLTGRQQRDILAFLQASNNPAVQQPYAEPTAMGQPDALAGKTIYDQTCVACHGPDGKGIFPGVPNFRAKDSRLTQSNEVLLKHIVEGFQSPGSPMAMPPKGGNPELTEADIRNVVQYLRDTFGS